MKCSKLFLRSRCWSVRKTRDGRKTISARTVIMSSIHADVETQRSTLGKICKYARVLTAITNTHGFVFIPFIQGNACFDGDLVELEIVDSPRTKGSSSKMPLAHILRVVSRSNMIKLGIVDRKDKFNNGRLSFVHSPEAPGAQLRLYLPDPTVPLGECVLFRDVSEEGIIVSETMTNNVQYVGNIMDRRSDAALANARTLRWRTCFERSDEMRTRVGTVSEEPYNESLRRDQTLLNTFTIDPIDSRDFDDALSWDAATGTIYVHIADVSAVVRHESEEDIEARQQMFTQYLPENATLHMLPRATMQALSLVPNENRPVLTAEFAWNESSQACNLRGCYRSLIRSKQRFHYQQVQDILEGRSSENDLVQNFGEILQRLHRIAQCLRAKHPEGVSLNLPVWRFSVDAQGRIDRHWLEHSNDEAHDLVKQFMLLANRAVAELLSSQGRVFPRRAHLPPTCVNDFVESNCKDQNGSSNFDQFSMMRNLTRAFYTIENMQHFGVGASEYAHFTSPIRRYIDLVLHRILTNDVLYTREELKVLCLGATHQTSVIDRCVEFYTLMKRLDWWDRHKHVEVIDGTIRTVNSAGVLVFLPLYVTEVFIPVQALGRGERLQLQRVSAATVDTQDGTGGGLSPPEISALQWVGNRKLYASGCSLRLRVRAVDYVRSSVQWNVVD